MFSFNFKVTVHPELKFLWQVHFNGIAAIRAHRGQMPLPPTQRLFWLVSTERCQL